MIASALALLLSAAAAPEPALFAIHVGVNDAPAGEPLEPLQYADDDAARLWSLTRLYAERSVLLATLDEKSQRRYPEAAANARLPRRAVLEAALLELEDQMQKARAAGRKVVLVFSYSGHGTRSAEGAEEVTTLTLPEGSLTQRFLEEKVVSLPADLTHLWLDACHAGGLVQERGFQEKEAQGRRLARAEADQALGLAFFQRHPHVGALISTSAGGPAHEWSELEAGVFTYELTSALAGAADINVDGVVDYSEVGAFVAAANRAIPDPRGRVDLVVEPPRQNRRAPLLDRRWRRAGATVVTERHRGRLVVRRDDGLRLLDAHTVEQPLVLTVPAGERLVFTLPSGHGADYAPRPGEAVWLETLSFVERASVAERGALDSALREGFFGQPYDRSYYEGYVDSRRLLPVRFDDKASLFGARGPFAFGPPMPPPRTSRAPEPEPVDEVGAISLDEAEPPRAYAEPEPETPPSAGREARAGGGRAVSALGLLGTLTLVGAAAVPAAGAVWLGSLAGLSALEAATTSLPLRKESTRKLAVGYGVMASVAAAIAVALAASGGVVLWLTLPEE